MFSGIIQYFYPDLKKEELNKFGHLAVAFLFTVGTYWLLRLVKDDVVYKIAFTPEFGWPIGYGATMVARLKTLSPFVVVGALTVYTKLIDLFEKHQLFYIIGSFFAAIFACIALILFGADTLGVDGVNAISFGPLVVGAAGAVGYLATEAFGSLMMALEKDPKMFSGIISINEIDPATSRVFSPKKVTPAPGRTVLTKIKPTKTARPFVAK